MGVHKALVPLMVVVVTPVSQTVVAVTAAARVGLAVLGGVGAKVGGAGISRSVLRVTLWGALARALTAGIGRLLGVVV